ncbi:MAG TPA: rhodanese-like domain-containing protein [Burkholderiales bacterium]|nr:rhodanese-like domain-containing protein [Burkholderiales bacterium]
MDFVRNNLLLFVTALVSGAMLLWPLVRRTTGGPWVNPAQATHLINREDAVILDVRDPAEFAAGHVLGARNVPLARLDAPAPDLLKRKERPVIVYCDGRGDRAGKAAAALKKAGFTRVTHLSGGIKAWQDAGLPLEK